MSKEFWINFNKMYYSICSEDGIYGYAQNLKETNLKLNSTIKQFNGIAVIETDSKAKQLLKMLEMARIGTYDNHLIYIYSESLKNPSFHLKYKDEWEVVLQIKDLSILEAKKGNLKRGQQLSSKEKKALIDFLHSDKHGISVWKFLLANWNANNEDYEVSMDIPIPS